MTNQSETKHFEDFEVWQEAHKLVVDTHRLTSIFDQLNLEIRNLLINTSQNITKFIVHGFNNRNPNDKFDSYDSALSASYAYHDALLTARDIGAFSDNKADFDSLLEQTISTRRRIVGLVKKYRELSK